MFVVAAVVRDAALRLRAWLAFSNPAHTPVAPGSIVLVAGCGNLVTVESFADVATPFILRVLGTPYHDEVALAGLKETLIFKAPPDGQPRTILKALPRGTVTATVGENEVARLPDTDRKPCPPPKDPPIYRKVPQSATATIVGTVVDAQTDQPMEGALVAAKWPARQGREKVQADGTFRLDWVEPGMVTIDVNCPSRTMLGAHIRDTVVRADTGKTTTISLRVERAGCHEPALGDRAITVRGVFSVGFEDSTFRPCADTTAEFKELWGPSNLSSAWVSSAPADVGRLAVDTSGTRDRSGSLVRYVEAVGVLHGPGSYGHMGVAPYLLELKFVQRVLPKPPVGCRVIDR